MNNRIISRQTLAEQASKAWARQYGHYPDGDVNRLIQAKLESLKSPVSPDEVDTIIGNPSWTTVPECDHCAKSGHPFVVQVGGGYNGQYDYERQSCNMCRGCLKSMVDLAEAQITENDT